VICNTYLALHAGDPDAGHALFGAAHERRAEPGGAVLLRNVELIDLGHQTAVFQAENVGCKQVRVQSVSLLGDPAGAELGTGEEALQQALNAVTIE